MNLIKNITLKFCEGSSNKIYKLAINETVDGFTVDYQYGRIGNNLISGTKTNSPQTFDKASSIYGKLISEKISKGYKEDGEGKEFTSFKWHPLLMTQE